MTFHRLVLGLKSIGRFIELWRCLRFSGAPVREIFAFLQVKRLAYPYMLKLRNGIQVELKDWNDLTTAWVVFYGNEYELRKDDRVVVDLGANFGAFSLLAANRLPEVKLYAVEPFPSNFIRLEETVATNSLQGQIDALQAAAVGTSGPVRMDDSAEIPSHSRKVGSTSGVEVKGFTLAEIFEYFGLEIIDFLKVDIEGAEYSLFEETPVEVLRKIKRIGMEYHVNGSRELLFSRLAEAGFEIGRFPKKGSSGVVEFVRK